ncbi:MAG: molybdopterin-dependent oxidoreductase [Myxococcota bacterium]
MHTVHKTCNLCEAMCGLLIQVDDGRVERIRADPDDPLSRGAICPKAIGLREIQEDPDRLRHPLRRTASGFEPIGWEEALRESARRLAEIQKRDGNDAVGAYLGNPGAHNFGIVMYLTGFYAALDTRSRFAASSLDQNPKHASSILLYGNFLSIPVPDLDRTDFLLVLGANPVVSNGSLMTAPGFRRRIRALHQRGGRLVVIDPRRSETAALADEHLFIEPGRDPLLLAALAHVILEEKLGRETHLEPFVDARPDLTRALRPFSPESIAPDLGIEAGTVRRLARQFARAPSAACYGRVGTCQAAYGTLNSWLIDVLNLLTGNLDDEGGILFPKPAADLAGLAERRGATGSLETRRTRVRQAPTFNGEQPTACLAEEILEPGEGQIRGMVTIAGNPCLSGPNGAALDRAFASLEFFVAIDFYLNETTRHADIILPPTWSLEHDNHEILFHGFAVRNTAKYSPVVIEPGSDQRHDWQILSDLALRVAAEKQGNALRRRALRMARRLVPNPRRALDWTLRLGPYGDGFRPWRRGLRLADLEASPSGIDLGPLTPRLAEMLKTAGRRIDLAPPIILAELERLGRDRGLPSRSGGELLLIGRRDVRSNNSWFHNIPLSTKGRNRCTLQMHPADAAARDLANQDSARIRSRVGEVTATVELTHDLREGVVSLPHGWGHRGEGLRMKLATEHAGVSCNDLVDEAVLEPVVGNAVMNGVPVRVRRAEPSARGDGIR